MRREFDNVVYAVFNTIGVGNKNAVKRKALASSFGDREARKAIEKLRTDYPVINLSDGKGYFLPEFTPEGIRQAEAYKRMQLARVNSIRRSLKGTEKFLREAGKKSQIPGQTSMFTDGGL